VFPLRYEDRAVLPTPDLPTMASLKFNNGIAGEMLGVSR